MWGPNPLFLRENLEVGVPSQLYGNPDCGGVYGEHLSQPFLLYPIWVFYDLPNE